MTVNETVAEFVVDTGYDDLPRKTVNYAKELALDLENLKDVSELTEIVTFLD